LGHWAIEPLTNGPVPQWPEASMSMTQWPVL
jgi:hypothetical protein